MGDVIEVLTTATNTVEVEAAGPQGTPGVGVPTGGSALQVLRKASGTDYDTEWAAAGSGSGSVTSVALAGTGLSISGSPVTTSGTITADVSYGSTAGTACEGDDARLSDTRDPNAHAASHAAGGSDPLAPSDIGAQSLFLGQNLDINASVITLTAARAKTVYLTNFFGASEIRLPETGATEGDVFKFVWGTGSPAVPIKQSISPFTTLETIGGLSSPRTFIRNIGVWSPVPVDTHTHELDALDATGATNGHVLTAQGDGTAAFEAAAGGGVTGAAASASDVLGVSGADITGVDATADRIVFWDDSASALKYLEAGSGLSLSGTTLTATGGASINQAIAVGFVLN